MRKRISTGLVFVAGLLATPPAGFTPTATFHHPPDSADPRLERLRRFFEDNNCPVREAAQEFLAAADRHGLDWRLLPSISLVESGGGRQAPNHNLFGWVNGRKRFRSVHEAIHTVAEALANATPYREKTLEDLLETYNPHCDYPQRVIAVMESLGPEEVQQSWIIN